MKTGLVDSGDGIEKEGWGVASIGIRGNWRETGTSGSGNGSSVEGLDPGFGGGGAWNFANGHGRFD
jgi:hypothetical protein